jgi:hypothetical protein
MSTVIADPAEKIRRMLLTSYTNRADTPGALPTTPKNPSRNEVEAIELLNF